MAMFLGALRFAVNVEHLLKERQNLLFRSGGDTSAMFLPPLVPVAVTTSRPKIHDLDLFRKRHHLRVEPGSTSASASISGFDGMAADYLGQFGPPAEDTPFAAEFATTRDGSAVSVYLSWRNLNVRDWSDPPLPVPLPETSALWLSLFEIEWGSGELWWSGGSWALYFSRRFTIRSRHPSDRR